MGIVTQSLKSKTRRIPIDTSLDCFGPNPICIDTTKAQNPSVPIYTYTYIWFSKTIYKTHTHTHTHHTHLVKIAATLRLSRRDKATQIFLFCMNSKCRLRWRRQLDKKEKTTLEANVWTSPASCPWSSMYTELIRLWRDSASCTIRISQVDSLDLIVCHVPMRKPSEVLEKWEVCFQAIWPHQGSRIIKGWTTSTILKVSFATWSLSSELPTTGSGIEAIKNLRGFHCPGFHPSAGRLGWSDQCPMNSIIECSPTFMLHSPALCVAGCATFLTHPCVIQHALLCAVQGLIYMKLSHADTSLDLCHQDRTNTHCWRDKQTINK